MVLLDLVDLNHHQPNLIEEGQLQNPLAITPKAKNYNHQLRLTSRDDNNSKGGDWIKINKSMKNYENEIIEATYHYIIYLNLNFFCANEELHTKKGNG